MPRLAPVMNRVFPFSDGVLMLLSRALCRLKRKPTKRLVCWQVNESYLSLQRGDAMVAYSVIWGQRSVIGMQS